MTEAEYQIAMSEANLGTYKWGADRWNEEFRAKLAKSGLTLTDKDPGGFYFMAPWPTPDLNGKPISVDEDPFSWPIPSWIVPLDIGGEDAG